MSSPSRDAIDLSQPFTVLVDRPRGGLFNMAADDHLLERGPAPCLRVYRWNRPTLSLGYRQRTDWMPPESTLKELQVEAVRRPSGGRALLHADELTYSLVVDCRGRPHLPSAYRRLTQLLCLALRELGLKVECAQETRLAPSRTHPGCMSVTAGGEILYQGQKLVGSAQVSRGNRLLQHGVVPFSFDPGLMTALLPSEGGLNGLEQMGAPRFGAEDLARAFLDANQLNGSFRDWTPLQEQEITADGPRWRV